MTHTSPHQNLSKGAALVGLVAILLIFSVLTAALVPMVSSSSQQGIAGNRNAKAYLLAESGYRFAASQFVNAGSEQAQNQALEDLDGNYTLDGNAGSFNLEVYSYFFELIEDVSGQNQLDVQVPGSFPGVGDLPDDPGDEIVLDTGLKIRIDQQTYTLASGSGETSDDTVRFFLNGPLSAHDAGTLVLPVADVDLSSDTSISNGDDLVYETGDGRMFPLRNGYIRVNGRTLAYGYNDRSANRFRDVRDPDDPDMTDFEVSSDPEIILTRYVRLHSTGTYGSGAMQSQRRVVYYTPIPLSRDDNVEEYSDPFDSKENWSDDTSGTSTIVRQTAGDSALTVEAAPTVGIDTKGGLTTFSPSSQAATRINFNASYSGTRGYLSYDSQIKVGYEADQDPSQGYDPVSPIPAYAGAGLSFRLGGSTGLFTSNGYGVSFLRGNDSAADNIPDDLVPIDDERVLVLWRQTGSGFQRIWLAYKRLNEVLLNEDNETETSNAFDDGSGSTDLWDLEPETIGGSSRQRGDSTRNWYYGITQVPADDYTYDWHEGGFPVRNTGTLESTEIAIPDDTPKVTLSFWSWYETEPGRLGTHDLKQVRITNSGGAVLRTYTIDGTNPPTVAAGPEDGWYQYLIDDLEGFEGQTIRIQFHFDTVDELNNRFEGWYLDDIHLEYHWSPTELQEATIAMRLKEAMVLRFDNGTSRINEGDRIYGGSLGTRGTVLLPPFLQSGTWGGSTSASGVLLLNDTTKITTNVNEYQVGEQLYVMGTTGQARVSAWDDDMDEKANIIQVFLATKFGRGDGTDGVGNLNPLDHHTVPYGRIGLTGTTVTQLQWPPILNASGNWIDDDGTWTAGEDYFQLVQWDAISTSASDLTPISFTSNGQGLVEDAILQSQHPDLQTPDYPGILEDPEVGLHALGDGAENVFFDDFGIRLIIPETDVLPSTVQQ